MFFCNRVTSEVEVASSSLLFDSNVVTDCVLFVFLVLSWLLVVSFKTTLMCWHQTDKFDVVFVSASIMASMFT